MTFRLFSLLGFLLIVAPGARAAEDLSSADQQLLDIVLAPAGATPLPLATRSYCQANCQGYGSASCSIAGSCTAVDRNCAAGERGRATCGATVVYCDACPSTGGGGGGGGGICSLTGPCGITSICGETGGRWVNDHCACC